MVLRVIFIFSFLFLFSCGVEDAEEQWSASAIENGKKLYTIHCTRCHGTTGDLGASGSKNLQISTLNTDAIQKIIREGKGAMPSYVKTLNSKEKLSWLSEYVISLRN